MSEYEYPTETEEQRVTDWRIEWLDDGKFPVYAPWFDFIRSLWWMPDWGWHEYDGLDDGDLIRVLHISTGGWSGNESLLAAMKSNRWNWGQTFYQHRRGGHYEFRFPRRSEHAKSCDAVGQTAENPT